MSNEQKRKPGRPRKENNLILYRSGRRVKAWNTKICAEVNIREQDYRGDNLIIYSGLGYDYVNWGKRPIPGGFYNAASTTPFRPAPLNVPADDLARLEEDYKNNPTLQRVMDACSLLFDGRSPDKSIIVEGAGWMRTLSSIYIREAGSTGLSRHHFEPPLGKIHATVNVAETQGTGFNFTLETWRAVIHMPHPPPFCIKIIGDGDAAADIPEGWEPKDLANAILHSLWSTRGVNSCDADVPKVTVEATPDADGEPLPTLPPIEITPMLTSDPDAVSDDLVLEPEVLPPDHRIPEATVSREVSQVTSQVVPEATPTPTARTWGEIKATMVSLKGLTSSNELQAPAPLSKILETVVCHEATKRLTDECRAIADKKARNEYKRDNMHVFYPSCVFAGRAGGSKKDNVTGYTGIACLDLDGMKTFAEAQDVRDDIFMSFPEVLFAAVSASGLGVYALVMLSFDGTEAGYRAALSGAMISFEAHGYMPDAGCVDPTRARYLSSDADALQRPDAYVPKAFTAEVDGGFILPATMLRAKWTNSGRKMKGAGKVFLEEALSRIENAPEGSKDTTITSVMGSVARLIRNYGMNSEKVYDQVRKVARDCGYCEKKTADKIRRLGVKSEGGML